MAYDPLIAVGDIFEVNAFCLFLEQVSINRVHYLCTSLTGGSGADIPTAIGPLTAPWTANLPALLCNQATFRGTLIRRVWPLARKTVYAPSATDSAGTGGADPLPRQSCGMFTKQSGVPGPGGRGRMYVPFPALLAQNGIVDQPNAGYMVNLGTLAAALFAPITVTKAASSAILSPIIYKRLTPASSNLFIAAAAKQKWATHRSRGDYGRPNVLPDALL